MGVDYTIPVKNYKIAQDRINRILPQTKLITEVV